MEGEEAIEARGGGNSGGGRDGGIVDGDAALVEARFVANFDGPRPASVERRGGGGREFDDVMVEVGAEFRGGGSLRFCAVANLWSFVTQSRLPRPHSVIDLLVEPGGYKVNH